LQLLPKHRFNHFNRSKSYGWNRMFGAVEVLHMAPWQAFIGLAIFLALIFQRGFWFVALTAGALAAGAGSLADLTHLHYVGALGHALLALACWAFAVSVAENAAPPSDKTVRGGGAHPHPSDHPDWSPH
jgi:hypothetical protein